MWRRFLPSTRPKPRLSILAAQTESPLIQAETLANTLLGEYHTFDKAIAVLKNGEGSQSATKLLTSLLLQTPRAARAQAEMDRHKRNFHDRHARLFELIDFNDTLVAAILALPIVERHEFVEQLRHTLRQFSAHQHTPNFSDHQYEAIVHGLSREIAVYLAAKNHGYDVLMTSRADDAFGVDMQIRDPQTNAYVNIDCKTHSSYYFRIKELVREKRLSLEQAKIADDLGYCPIVNRHNDIEVHVVLARIDHTIQGDIVDFEFVAPELIIQLLHDILERCPLYDSGYGKTIAPLDF